MILNRDEQRQSEKCFRFEASTEDQFSQIILVNCWQFCLYSSKTDAQIEEELRQKNINRQIIQKKKRNSIFQKMVTGLGKGFDTATQALGMQSPEKNSQQTSYQQQNQPKQLQKRNESNFNFLPFIFPFGVDRLLDKNVNQLINFQRPVFDMVPGVQGISHSFSFLLGCQVRKHIENDEIDLEETKKQVVEIQSWKISSYYTTLQALSITLFFVSSVQKEQSIVSRCLVRFGNLLEILRKQVQTKELSISFLTNYCFDKNVDVISSSCNLIISSIISKTKTTQHNDTLKEIATHQLLFQQFLNANLDRPQQPCGTYDMKIILILGYYYVYSKSRYRNKSHLLKIVETLINVINLQTCVQNPILLIAALKLLIDGGKIFLQQVSDIKKLVVKLINIQLHYHLSHQAKSGEIIRAVESNILHKGIYKIHEQSIALVNSMKYLSNKVIVSMAAIMPDKILKILKSEVEHINVHNSYPGLVLEILRSIIKKHGRKFITYLHVLIEIILNCLNPNIPSLRKNCQKKCTYCLYTIVKIFPMVCFHQSSQRFAIGTKDNLIIIYDLRTAAKWRILEGHEGSISSIAFDNAGKYISSFSNRDQTVRIWKVGSTGFFGSILGMSGKHYKKFKVPSQKKGNPLEKSHSTIEWTVDNKRIILSRENEKKIEYKVF